MSTDLSPGQLYDRCRAQERELETKTLRDEFEDPFVFGPLLGGNVAIGVSDKVVAYNYRLLVKMLRDEASADQKWRLLAMWLRDENIWQPREFLPKAIRKRLIAATFAAFQDPDSTSKKQMRSNRVVSACAQNRLSYATR